MQLMRSMVAEGEVDALVPDRVWKETESALVGNSSRVFFEVLRRMRGAARALPRGRGPVRHPATREMASGDRHRPARHDGARTGRELSGDLEVRFAALVHDLGKGTTPRRVWPSHAGHEQRGVKLIRSLAKRLPVPNSCRDLGMLAAEFHTHCHRAYELRADTILRVLESADAFRRPERFEQFLLTCEADARGRKGLEQRDYAQADLFRGALAAALDVDSAGIAACNEGNKIPEAIRKARLAAVKAFRATFQVP